MSQYAYGSIPDSEPAEVADGDQPQHPSELIEEGCFPEARHRIGKVLESKRAHMAILGLTVFDILLVILQIGASLLHLDETKEELWVLKLFEHLSLAIVSFFVLEILLKLFTFGPKYFWKGTHHGILHLIDAVIIFISFFLEVFVKSTEALELGSLLIIFRLWRIVKLTGTVAIEVNEQDGYKIKDLQLRVRQLEQQLEESQAEVTRLRQFTQDQV
ncbi:hypothetical protein DFQ27_004787 [Actinomortierella ambigua]|uniref:Voltage-gated hydrogen channel 1 n=1 Tax=Actinomortierella ambigua TaxID=1343610 RepID=A0A9P6Q0T5_9FUNG|nr:hypothetical protein DFQ27_004787 [Actinomortierella ambigua]